MLIFLNLLVHKKASTQCPYRHLKHRLSQRLMYQNSGFLMAKGVVPHSTLV
ncbi:hypothetical protein BAZSYMA_ACONTIG98791_0 [Bathymodiolus azoricus thioautotrophic gill symbiont]|uniref:Uncharacterized protein n=1 Tax=Bathymodiolus azoricus thioautotrophic gill symbiont TaxID=235205 RepID=A0A1H6JAR9_9GAMM|nr:hypothetical protein BAZSYMA_ACONTIG98791_0 [Bathymodiolus azoricus thioautotrophic gill symbiont]